MNVLNGWLQEQGASQPTPTYRHRQFRALRPSAAVRSALQAFARDAHRDAVRRMERLLRPTLAPFPGAGGATTPASGYPYKLHPITLQGYFGELLSGAMVTMIEPFSEGGWEVPAFRWRFHIFDLYRSLERHRMEGTPIPQLFGAHGDDCTAFRLDDTGLAVRDYLVCEAKCTTKHSASLVAKSVL